MSAGSVINLTGSCLTTTAVAWRDMTELPNVGCFAFAPDEQVGALHGSLRLRRQCMSVPADVCKAL